MKVLVLDDKSLIVRDIIRCVNKVIENVSCKGFVIESEALDYASNNPIDVALLDIDMPHINGIEVAKRLLEINSKINIIFITAHPKYARESYDVKASDFIVKPIDEEDLKKAFEKLRYPVLEKLSGNKLPNNLKKYREEADISIKELAKKLNCSYQAIYRWENGDRIPDISTIIEISKILNITINDLLK